MYWSLVILTNDQNVSKYHVPICCRMDDVKRAYVQLCKEHHVEPLQCVLNQIKR